MPISPYLLLPRASYGRGLSAVTSPAPSGSGAAAEIPVAEDAQLFAVPFAADLAPEVGLPLPAAALLAHYEAKGEAGEVVEVPVANGETVGRVLLYGIGDGSAGALRKAGAAVARRGKGRDAIRIVLPEGPVAAFVEGALLATYTFRIGEVKSPPVAVIEFVGDGAEAEVARGEVIAKAVALARDLANMPSSVKTPAWLAERAVEQGVTAKVWDEEELRAGRFGGIVAVGQGSANPPRLIRLSYEPEGATGHVVLVGKGITYDTGGLSLKPTEGMKFMKTDMAGGAVVIAVLGALAALGVRVRVTGLIAAAENAFSGTAQRPSDVITQYGGRTVEVLNTDAEGRLVMADALAYADAELDPDVMVDIATLTGAIGIALGKDLGAVFASDDDLAAELAGAGESTGERLWRMPLIDDYVPALDSSVADLANIEVGSSYGAGSVTAALFLREFTGKRPWAHLDIAGVGRSSADEGIFSKGATGYGVRLLLEWLSSR
ncbi:leucyl aminopeptidase [Streptosporangium roseum]|uniref:Probable cytosol aminopeptidase n=1 Tax=Streptosporangium roseum (strain ATCC 12428 / DSM 43021 / JCM 3005 / KCTC 9067 / NCIMB 10171 / NRRL 2505 / NI 9100) TaxID=479432 RepID=D2B0Q1_STRRD|nr:leucyl aminopeptidase [Streptosporangium roseum]ACZ91063.1 Leucyl aminopeptidase [Streptosporangium roseum DSM 43021]